MDDARRQFPLQQGASARILIACQSGDPNLFFSEKPTDVASAKLLCEQCLLKDSCLNGAMARHEPWGVWGGELLDYGVIIAFKRGRGRPRKYDVAS